MRTCLLLSLIALAIAAPGQENEKARTRQIDYTTYDQLVHGLYYAPDKPKAIEQLKALVASTFTPEDEEYFQANYTIGLTYDLTLQDMPAAMQHFQKAVDAYEKHYPFAHRGYAMVTPDLALSGYFSLSKAYRTLSLFDKAVKLLEVNQQKLVDSAAPYVLQQFYSEYGQALLGLGDYPRAIEVGNKLKELSESGALNPVFPSADEIYKINATDPPEVQEQMKKAKVQYENSLRIGAESTLAMQQSNYNMILGYAYYYQYQFAEAAPILKNMLDAIKKMMALSAEGLALSLASANAQTPADSKQQMLDAQDYLNTINQLGGSATLYLIAAAKSQNKADAAPYATGSIDKAIWHQLNDELALSERAWLQSFATIKSLSQYVFASTVDQQYNNAYLPFYLNLMVRSKKWDIALQKSQEIIEREESILKKSFQFFSEGEKKEFFKGYNEKLEKHLSLLFELSGERKTSGDILNKVLQTKGLILDVSREQEKRLKQSKDKNLLNDVRMIRRWREKLAAFYQLNQRNPTPAYADSINRISVKVNEAERKLNEKLGTSSTILEPVDWRNIQNKLKPGEVFLEIVRLKRDNFNFDKPKIEYWGFAVYKGITEPVSFRIGEGETFEGRSLKNYQNRMRSQLDDNDSYQTYWSAIDKTLKGFSTIYFSGDGVYHMINPLTLKNTATQQFLANTVDIVRLSTGRDLLKPRGAIVNVSTISLIGNPDFAMSRKGALNVFRGNEADGNEVTETGTRSGFSALPGTEKEVGLLDQMARQNGLTTSLLSGAKANESQVKAINSPHILHVATHGEFDARSKADSYLRAKLILAGAGDQQPFTLADYSQYEDGFLTAYEVTLLNLEQTQLVVLSACETGLGEIQSGEGVWGLQRAFQLAGAQRVMGSLWKISDEATVLFMETFYTNYFSSKNVRQAFKAAMMSTMKSYGHPYYWGAFTLVGQ